MLECTINRSHGLENHEMIYNHLEAFGLKVLLIAREEKNELHDTHFHVLVDNGMLATSELYTLTNIVFRDVRDEEATLVYFTKEGKYKCFNGFQINLSRKQKLDMKQVIEDITNGYDYIELVMKYGLSVVKYCYGIKALIADLQIKNRKENTK